MTRAAKITYFAALVIGLSIGAFFGFQTTAPLLEAYYAGRQLTAPMAFSRFSYLQCSYADAAHAQAALEIFAKHLEELEKLQPEKTQERELAFTYTGWRCWRMPQKSRTNHTHLWQRPDIGTHRVEVGIIQNLR